MVQIRVTSILKTSLLLTIPCIFNLQNMMIITIFLVLYFLVNCVLTFMFGQLFDKLGFFKKSTIPQRIGLTIISLLLAAPIFLYLKYINGN